MRYWVALAVAVLIIALGVLFVWHTQHSIEQRFRQGLREARVKGMLPPGIDPEQANPGDFGIMLSAAEMRRVEIANLFIARRFVLIPMVLIVSLGVARLLRRQPLQDKAGVSP